MTSSIRSTKPFGAIAHNRGLGLQMYADDTQLYISFKHVGCCELAKERIEACVTEMRSCMYKNKLQLNDAKTEVMLIYSVHELPKFSVSPAGQEDNINACSCMCYIAAGQWECPALCTPSNTVISGATSPERSCSPGVSD